MKLKGIELKGTYKVEFYGEFFAVYDLKGNHVYSKDSKGYWDKSEYDSQGNRVYFENSNGFWVKSDYDSQGNRVYFENSDGYIIDKRVKKLTIEEIEKLLCYKIKVKGE